MKEELYIVLKPSKIHGVGVFTERNIRAGEYLRIWLVNDWRYILLPQGRLKAMCNHFGVAHKNGNYSAPRNFMRMSVAWYLNDSPTPNVRITKSGRAYAIRKIRKGDELTISYSTLDTDIDNSVSPPIPHRTKP